MKSKSLHTYAEFSRIANSQTYLVGGAVRDQLLGIPNQDKDWLIVGASPKDMLQAGFRQIGKDFPVFLHPESKEEYALARTERKSGHGYQGFEFNFSETTTLEEDLQRRDLTINAIAMDQQGNLHDPHNGQQDLTQRILRHVSPAFVEDPLRVLRVARFSAQLAPFGFTLANETRILMQSISANGELDHLQSDRIWQETARALTTTHPHIYIQILRETHALSIIFPELDALFGVPQTAKYHPEIDSGIHTLMVMEQSAKLSDELSVRFAAMTHDFGKGTTPHCMLPSHKGHEQRSYQLLQKFYQRIPVPKSCQDLANKVAKFHLHAHRAFELKPNTILKLFVQLDAFRKPDTFEHYLLACLADSKGRAGFEDKEFPEIDFFRACYHAANTVNAAYINRHVKTTTDTIQGKQLGAAIDKERIRQIAQIKQQWDSRHV